MKSLIAILFFTCALAGQSNYSYTPTQYIHEWPGLAFYNPPVGLWDNMHPAKLFSQAGVVTIQPYTGSLGFEVLPSWNPGTQGPGGPYNYLRARPVAQQSWPNNVLDTCLVIFYAGTIVNIWPIQVPGMNNGVTVGINNPVILYTGVHLISNATNINAQTIDIPDIVFPPLPGGSILYFQTQMHNGKDRFQQPAPFGTQVTVSEVRRYQI